MNKKIFLFLLFIIFNLIKICLFHLKISNISFSFILYEFFLSFLIYFLIFNLKSRIIFGIFYFIQFLYLSINFTYFNYFKIYLTLNIFTSLLWQGFVSFLKGAFPFYPFIFIFLIDFPFFLILLSRKNFFEVLIVKKLLKFVFVFFSLIFLFFYFMINLPKVKEKERIYDFTADLRILEKFGIFAFQIDDFFKKKDYLKDLKASQNFIEGEKKEKFYNIIFIQVESMDSFIIEKKIEEEEVMPYLYGLKEKSIFYPYVISYHYGGGTSDCEFSIFNSIEPLLNFPSINLSNYRYENSFLKILRKNGYKIKAFHGNEGSFWNRNFAFAAMGFEEFYDINKMKLKMKGWGAEDKEVFEFMLRKMKEEKEPFFYYIITMSSHMPFTNVLNYYRNEKFEKVENRVLRNYFLSMNYVDSILKKYLEEFLKFQDTYIFIYGDHVGVYSEDGYKGSFLELDGLKVELVPLLIISPEKINYKEENCAVSFLDFAPTALSASGVSFKYYSDGQNLLNFPIKNTKISPFNKKYDRLILFQMLKGKRDNF